MKPIISLIAAIGKNRELGKNNQLLWDIPEDMKFFRETTAGHPVIMGRKTFESIGRPLPKRVNIVITRNLDYQKEGILVFPSIEEALEEAKKHDENEVFVIGGAEIYKQSLPFADKLYLTHVDANFDADTFFPEYETSFPNIISKKCSSNEMFEYCFEERKR